MLALKPPGEEPSLTHPSGGCRKSLLFLIEDTSFQFLPLLVTWCSLCVSVSLFFIPVKTPVTGLGPTLIQYDFTLTNYICKDCFQISSLYQVLDVRILI